MALLSKPGLIPLKIENNGVLITSQINKINFVGGVSGSIGNFNDITIQIGVIPTASFAISSSYASFSTSASYASASTSASYASASTSASYASASTSASYALTASYVANASSFPFTGSALITGSLGITGSLSQSGSTNIFLQGLINQTTATTHVVTFNNATGQLFITASSAFGGGGGGGGTPGGVTNTIQFNNAGTFSGSNNFTLVGGNTVSLTGSLLVTGSSQFLGPVTGSSFTGSFTGSLFGTSSWAVSASRAISSSYSFNATSASYANTASYSQNLIISGSINNVDYIDFNTASATPAHKSGRVFWDNTDGALSVYNAEADITLQVGQENWTRVSNRTGATILNGTAVRLLGAHGDVPEVELAQSLLISGSVNLQNQILGIATHDIENNSKGYITTQGLVRGLNTSAFSDGDTLFVGTGSAGVLQNIAPLAPYEIIPIGVCVKAGPGGSGIIYVAVQEPIDFSDLSSVLVTGSYSIGDIWTYVPSGSTGAWSHTNQLSGSYGITGSLRITGSVTASSITGSFTGSLFGTSSWAVSASQAISSSRAVSSSFAISSSYALSASNAFTSSFSQTSSFVTTAQTASYVLQSVSASFATSASTVYIASNSGTNTNYTLVFKNSTLALDNYYQLAADGTNGPYYNPSTNILGGVGGITISGSIGIFNSITGSSITGSLTGSLLGTASFATTASYALAAQSFPYTGSAIISGSLGVTGSISQADNLGGLSITQEIISSSIPLGLNAVVTKTISGPASMFLDYQIISGSNQRTGTIIANFNNLGTPTSTYYETVTGDIGNTSMISFLTDGTPPYTIQANNSGPNPYTFKAILRYF